MQPALVRHLQASRVFHRPERPFTDFKLQTATHSFRARVFYPVQLELAYDHSPAGFAALNPDRRFAPLAPLHVEYASPGALTVAIRRAPPEWLGRAAARAALSAVQLAVYVEALRPTVVGCLEFGGRWSASLSHNPLCLGLTYAGRRAGAEFIYNALQEQPGLSGLFHGRARNTEISLIASMYGAVAALATTRIGPAKVSSLVEANFFTLAATTAHAVTWRYRDLNLTVGVTFPSNRLTFDVGFESERINGIKTGLDFFFPIATTAKAASAATI
jgi:hypothetical protein